MVSLMEDGILLVVSQYPSVAGVPNIQFFSTINTSLNQLTMNNNPIKMKGRKELK